MNYLPRTAIDTHDTTGYPSQEFDLSIDAGIVRPGGGQGVPIVTAGPMPAGATLSWDPQLLPAASLLGLLDLAAGAVRIWFNTHSVTWQAELLRNIIDSDLEGFKKREKEVVDGFIALIIQYAATTERKKGACTSDWQRKLIQNEFDEFVEEVWTELEAIEGWDSVLLKVSATGMGARGTRGDKLRTWKGMMKDSDRLLDSRAAALQRIADRLR